MNPKEDATTVSIDGENSRPILNKGRITAALVLLGILAAVILGVWNSKKQLIPSVVSTPNAAAKPTVAAGERHRYDGRLNDVPVTVLTEFFMDGKVRGAFYKSGDQDKKFLFSGAQDTNGKMSARVYQGHKPIGAAEFARSFSEGGVVWKGELRYPNNTHLAFMFGPGLPGSSAKPLVTEEPPGSTMSEAKVVEASPIAVATPTPIPTAIPEVAFEVPESFWTFFDDSWKHNFSNDAAEWAGDFANSVDYCWKKNGPASRSYIESDRNELIARYPTRDYSVAGQPTVRAISSDEVRASYTYTYSYEGRKHASGRAHVSITARLWGGNWEISRFDETVDRD